VEEKYNSFNVACSDPPSTPFLAHFNEEIHSFIIDYVWDTHG